MANFSNESDYFPPIEDMVAVMPPVDGFLILLYSITTFYSLVGNVVVIFVMIGGKRSSRDLKYLLTNLAVSDIMMAIFCIPFTYTSFLFNRWIFWKEFCPVVQFFQHCFVTVSVYTLTAIGIDRFYAVWYPLKLSWIRSRTSYVIASIWLFSICFSLYILIETKAKPFPWGDNIYHQCIEPESQSFAMIAFFFAFLIPMVMLAFCYSFIAIKLYRKDTPGNIDEHRDQRQREKKIKIMKMLVLIVVLFAICWLPLHIFNLFVMFYPRFTVLDTDSWYYTYVYMYLCLHWIAMSNSFINPLIYSFMCENFRADLGSLLKKKCNCFTRSNTNSRNINENSSVACYKPSSSTVVSMVSPNSHL